MTKKIFAISTLLLVVVIAAIFVYNFAFKKSSSSKSGGQKTSQEGKVVTQSNQSSQVKNDSGDTSPITAASDEAVFGAALSADGNYLYYFLKSNGQLNQTDLSGKLEKVISTETFFNLKKVIWNKPKNKVVLKLEPAPGKTKFLYFDISEKKIFTLKENLDSATWCGTDDKIAYKYFDPKTKKRTVSVSDSDGKNWRDLASFDYYGVEISSGPGSSNISFWPSPNAYTATSVNTMPFSGGDKKEILRDKYGVDLLWSPDGTRAAVSFSDQKGGHKMELAITNSQGGQFQNLMWATFSSKCTWSADSRFLFCALPGNIPDSAILPNDWQEGKVSPSDTFWKIEASSGKKERLVETEKIVDSYDAINPFLSKDEKTLFFTNKSDGKLYRLNF
jgi:hypothetical protein